jgi:hypothetical protein
MLAVHNEKCANTHENKKEKNVNLGLQINQNVLAQTTSAPRNPALISKPNSIHDKKAVKNIPIISVKTCQKHSDKKRLGKKE